MQSYYIFSLLTLFKGNVLLLNHESFQKIGKTTRVSSYIDMIQGINQFYFISNLFIDIRQAKHMMIDLNQLLL